MTPPDDGSHLVFSNDTACHSRVSFYPPHSTSGRVKKNPLDWAQVTVNPPDTSSGGGSKRQALKVPVDIIPNHFYA
jgi:hypothetical protein